MLLSYYNLTVFNQFGEHTRPALRIYWRGLMIELVGG